MSLPYPASACAVDQTQMSLSHAQHPVLFFANGYGDHYLNLPAIRALVQHYQGRLTLLGMQGAMELIALGLDIRQLVTVPMKHSPDGRLFEVEQIVKRIPECDLFISLNPWFNDDLQCLLEDLGKPLSVGFFEQFSVCIDRDYNKHTIDLTFDVVQRICRDYTPECFSQEPEYRQEDIETANKIASMLPANKKVMCIHTDTLPEKMWPDQAWTHFLDDFLEAHSDFCVLMVGVNGIDHTACKHAEKIIDACGLSISVSGLLLAKSHVFVGIDSVFLHIADLWAVPTIALFGPTQVHEWGVRFGPAKHLSSSQGMRGISVHDVLAATHELLAQSRVNTQK